MKLVFSVTAVAVLVAIGSDSVRSSDQSGPDISMLVQNFEHPFVGRHFAERLGQLVISETYQAAVVTVDQPPEVSDKGDFWAVTIKVERWLLPPIAGTPLAPRQLTVSIRKADAAIVSIK